MMTCMHQMSPTLFRRLLPPHWTHLSLWRGQKKVEGHLAQAKALAAKKNQSKMVVRACVVLQILMLTSVQASAVLMPLAMFLLSLKSIRVL